MSLLIKEKNEREKPKEENGKSNLNNSKNHIDEKEEVSSNITNLKVFNGLLEEDNIFKNLNTTNKNSKSNINANKNNKNDLDVYFNNNKMIDLNYISFGDCDNLFVNNINTKKNIDDKKIKKESKSKNKKDKNSSHSKNKTKKNKHSHSKKYFNNIKINANNNIKNITIQKKYIEEILINDNKKLHKTMSFNDPKEINNEKQINLDKEIIEKKEKKCKNYFKISSIKNGMALLVTGDDIVFTFPAYLLPRGAKLGETFALEIKLFDKTYNEQMIDEIEQIQKKYSNDEIVNDNNK